MIYPYRRIVLVMLDALVRIPVLAMEDTPVLFLAVVARRIRQEAHQAGEMVDGNEDGKPMVDLFIVFVC